MAKVTVKNLYLENYKGVQLLDTALYNRSFICGRNATGKTTCADAIVEILTGKMFDGTTPDNVRPHDANGVEIDRIPVIRRITVEIDGKDHVIEKKTEQKWQRKRGSTEEVFTGNQTSYVVDGFETSPVQYAKWVEENIAPVEKILQCMNPQTFINILKKSTVDAREFLEKASGFCLEDFIASKPEFSEINSILAGHTVEETTKQLNKQKTAQAKELTASETNFSYEKSKAVSLREVADIADLENQVNETKTSLDFIVEQNKKHSEVLFQLDVLRGQLDSEKKKAKEEEQKSMDSAMKMVLNLQETIHATDKELERKSFEGNTIKSNITSLELQKKDAEQNLKEAEESKPESDNFVCKFCGQIMPVDKIAEATDRFETEKKKAIEGYKGVINYFSGMIDGNNKKLEEVKESIEQLNAKKPTFKSEYEKAINAYNQMKSMPYPIPEEVAKLEAEIKALEEKEKSVAGYDKEIAACTQHIMELNAQINEARSNELFNKMVTDQHTKELENLANLIRDKAQGLAYLEREIDLLKSFSVEKNKALADKVNPHFKAFQFSFIGFNQDGSTYETLRIMCNGTDYLNGLNGGDKRLCDISLLEGLQELNGLNLPIIVDETVTVDTNRIPQTEQQLICLWKNEEPKVTVMEG